MADVTGLHCVTCGAVYRPDEMESTCPVCGPRYGTLEVRYDYDAVQRNVDRDALTADAPPSMWRYLPLLPIRSESFIQPLRVGWTPVYRFPKLAHELTLSDLVIKDDGQNPTASYKDRASALVVIKAQEMGRDVVVCASTGNAASSLAGFAAATSLTTVIFVPHNAPAAKVTQLLVYGARVFLVEGSYDDAYDLAAQAAEQYGWYNRSAAINPYLVEGKKTGALELAEQLNWAVPDVVFVSVGDGSIISGLCKGFTELHRLGWVRRLPRVIGVQAEGAAALAHAFHAYRGGSVALQDNDAQTVADSICVGKPRDVVKAVTWVTAIGGTFITVSDDEILRAQVALSRRTGVFAEPAGAAAYAGLLSMIRAGELNGASAAVFLTGHGLKDLSAARLGLKEPVRIPPDLAALEAHLR